MRVLHKILLNLIIAVTLFVIFYFFETGESHLTTNFENLTFTLSHKGNDHKTTPSSHGRPTPIEMVTLNSINSKTANSYNIWCIFTKVTSHAPMKQKFHAFTHSLVMRSSVQITLHIITDTPSKMIAESVLQTVKASTQKNPVVLYYDVDHLAEELHDIVSAMQPHFSSQPGTYYSDALFFLSLGLHRIAKGQSRAAMFDADTMLRAGVEELFEEFSNFNNDTLFGLAPELTPVYRHVLFLYRSKHNHTRFGEPLPKGFPGVNSGVILFHLDNMRSNLLYNQLLDAKSVRKLAAKYSFKGHLGDQDFYTLLAMEHPNLVHLLPCNWNRQLCTWWRDHGYREVFDAFAYCRGPVKLYHGNCNTPIPNN